MNHPKLRIAFIALLVCALLPTASAQLVVQTPIDTNFGTGWDGIMFDVEATVDLRLTDIETFLFPGTRTIEVWVQNIYGGFDGDETSRENWTLVGSKTLTVGTAQQLVSLGIPMDIDIPAGLSRGIYITGIPSAPGSSVPYTAGFNPGGTRAQNGDLRITGRDRCHVPLLDTDLWWHLFRRHDAPLQRTHSLLARTRRALRRAHHPRDPGHLGDGHRLRHRGERAPEHSRLRPRSLSGDSGF